MVQKMAWVILASAIAMASPATAQDHACEADQKKFCSSSEGLHVLKCLVDHFNELTPECKTQMGPARERIEGAKKTPAATGAADSAKPAKP